MSSDRTKQICLWMTIDIYTHTHTHTHSPVFKLGVEDYFENVYGSAFLWKSTRFISVFPAPNTVMGRIRVRQSWMDEALPSPASYKRSKCPGNQNFLVHLYPHIHSRFIARASHILAFMVREKKTPKLMMLQRFSNCGPWTQEWPTTKGKKS